MNPHGRIDRHAGIEMLQMGVIYTSLSQKEEDLLNDHRIYSASTLREVVYTLQSILTVQADRVDRIGIGRPGRGSHEELCASHEASLACARIDCFNRLAHLLLKVIIN